MAKAIDMLSKHKLLENILGIEKIKQIDEACSDTTNIKDSSAKALEILDVSYKLIHGNLKEIPKTGRVIIAANHPFGGIEGLILINLIAKVRTDFKVIVTSMLSEIKLLSEYTILVDVFANNEINTKAIRTAKKLLDSEQAIVIFPAGEVSSYSIKSRIVVDPKWHKILGYLSQKTMSDIIPINFSGRNSAIFQTLGLIHPILRTSMLPRELLNKKQKEIKLSIGRTIFYNDWLKIKDSQELTDFVKLNSYILDANNMLKPNFIDKDSNLTPLMKLPDWVMIYQEISEARSSKKIISTNKYEVFIVDGQDLSISLLALGIIRERTFREIAEGTGKAYDLDEFDNTYQHIILVNTEAQHIAGAYRMLTHNKNTSRKSYLNTLMRYSKKFISWLEPAIELGRAFVHPEEQKSPLPLSLIWRAIFLYMSDKKITKIYGTVSIPANISPLARELILHFLALNHTMSPPKGKIYVNHKVKLQIPQWRNLGLCSVRDIKQINWLLDQISDSSKFPGLIKHYLNLGCKCFSFSWDPSFGNVIDCLFVLDLSLQKSAIVKRLVGDEIYQEWLQK